MKKGIDRDVKLLQMRQLRLTQRNNEKEGTDGERIAKTIRTG